jgi:hypothetical protein
VAHNFNIMQRSSFLPHFGILTLIGTVAITSSVQAAKHVTPDASPEARALLKNPVGPVCAVRPR